MNDLRNTSGYDVRGRLDVGLPYPNNGVSGLGQVSILAPVDLHAFSLAGVRLRKLYWMPMPIIAVELDHYSAVVEDRIDAKFTEEERLLFILKSEAVQHFIAGQFKLVELIGHLIDVHLDQHFPTVWVGVPTCWRTVSWDCVPLARRRPLEVATACFAGVAVFIPTLPCNLMFDRAKKDARFLELTGLDVDGVAAIFASTVFAGLALWTRIISVTLQRAVFLTLPHAVCNHLAATDALNRADLVALFAFGQETSLQFHEVI